MPWRTCRTEHVERHLRAGTRGRHLSSGICRTAPVGGDICLTAPVGRHLCGSTDWAASV
ncbi:hypothetical protein KIH86_05440 [Paenibacillus sp. HN-1]|uniref:hypothetical protein n=1 Tax=Paenibacillus TaxID=44249 RepID=UPI001CA8ACE6|nr:MULTISPECIES: hypothetical protein [Paenibacillus]MBY9077745.1 hypothetical protein [Paenibacillus sp. CGMCC 1.18879]MBY9083676.1 hypothetical protein [Paenibacillus sinensis]